MALLLVYLTTELPAGGKLYDSIKSILNFHFRVPVFLLRVHIAYPLMINSIHEAIKLKRRGWGLRVPRKERHSGA